MEEGMCCVRVSGVLVPFPVHSPHSSYNTVDVGLWHNFPTDGKPNHG